MPVCWVGAEVPATIAHLCQVFRSMSVQVAAYGYRSTNRDSGWNSTQTRFNTILVIIILGTPAWRELERSLLTLFGRNYPQVLTHGDLSRTNVLVDEDTHEGTGIVDWSLASILPFGMDLDCLFLTTVYMDRDGWYNYACRSRLHEAFWTEFWSVSEVRNNMRQYQVRDMAEREAKIRAILRYAFQRNADGSPSETLMSDGASTWRHLQAWLATWLYPASRKCHHLSLNLRSSEVLLHEKTASQMTPRN